MFECQRPECQGPAGCTCGHNFMVRLRAGEIKIDPMDATNIHMELIEETVYVHPAAHA